MRTTLGIVGFIASFALLGNAHGLAQVVGAIGVFGIATWLVCFVWPADDEPEVWYGDDRLDAELAERIRRSVSHIDLEGDR